MTEHRRHVKVGDVVRVPWGLEEPVPARVIEIWGIRRLRFEFSCCLMRKTNNLFSFCQRNCFLLQPDRAAFG